ncbi:MAG: 3'-5' exonuclease, partial [Chitinophagaceae bacterium]
MFLIFDTETTGLPRNWDAPVSDLDNWPRCIQLAWQLHDEKGRVITHQDFLVKPNGFDIPYDSERIHGISTELATADGVDLEQILVVFNEALSQAKYVVGQNIKFDLNIMGAEFLRHGQEDPFKDKIILDTCTEVTAELLKIPGGRGGRFKLPNLTELHSYLFKQPFSEAHNATADVEATTRCFFELLRNDVFSPQDLQVDKAFVEAFKEDNTELIQAIGLQHINLKAASAKLKVKEVR